MYIACRNGDLATLQSYQSRMPWNRALDSQGNTALHIATLHRHRHLVAYLLQDTTLAVIANDGGHLPCDTLDHSPYAPDIEECYRT